jgi:hypothetical protein
MSQFEPSRQSLNKIYKKIFPELKKHLLRTLFKIPQHTERGKIVEYLIFLESIKKWLSMLKLQKLLNKIIDLVYLAQYSKVFDPEEDPK